MPRLVSPQQYKKAWIAEHEALVANQMPERVNIHFTLKHVDNRTARRLARYREGHKTVALNGLAPSSCSLAPFEDENVEIWCLNEGHVLPWMVRWDRWFQMHKPNFYQRVQDLGGLRLGHYDWLKQEHGDKPIYMLEEYPDVPNAVKYPLSEVTKLLGSVRIGHKKIKFFHSTFDYMIALAIHEGFTRIEIYGFEFTGDYEEQRHSAYFWKGLALGKGIELYEPSASEFLFDPLLYGYSYVTLRGGERVSNANESN